MTNDFSQRLLAWYDRHGRHDLPWQQQRNLYRVWVSEIMLQQTQVSTVIPYFEGFMARFPDVVSLANAATDEVLHHWTGLGYYARARNLHKAAQQIRDDYQGQFPTDFDAVLALPGIGRSTAGAILAQALDQRQVILDGNVKRVLTRLAAIEGWPGQTRVEQQLWQLADQLTPQQRLADYTQAIMDLGATVCGRKPRCADCPMPELCRAYQQGNPQDYPTPKPRKSLPVRETMMLLLRNSAQEILLQQRPPAGIWGGLWSLPECSSADDVAAWCAQQFGLQMTSLELLPALRHTFSHFHLDITPLLVEIKPLENRVMEPHSIVWYNVRRPEKLGLPAPVVKILSTLAATEQEKKQHESNGELRKTEKTGRRTG